MAGNEPVTVGIVTTTSNQRQISDGNGLSGGPGNTFGQSPLDLISFFGAPSVVQPSGGFEAAATSMAGGLLNSYAPTLSPASVAANTTAEQTFTVTGLAATSLVIVNKPTAQAGLGIAGVRVSAANTLAINFSNDTSGSITPTASEVYQVTELTAGDGLVFTASLSPAAVAANTNVEQLFTVASGNVAIGTAVAVNKPTSQAGLGIAGARVSAANQVAITFFNNTASPITPTAAESYSFASLNGLSAASNVLLYDINVGTLAGVAPNTTAEQNLLATGVLATDVAVGVSKPTAQAGLGIVGQRVVQAGTVGINFINATGSTITPTGSEIYKVELFRTTPVAPMTEYAQTLTPVSVAANTTAEQSFTVTGLVSATAVAATKPSLTPGIAVVNARVSAGNTLALTYQNDTAAAIVPPAEIYLITNFPQTEGGAEVSQAVTNNGGNNLVNAMRGALVSLGLIAGA